MKNRVTGDVPGTAGPHSMLVDSLVDRSSDGGMGGHTEVVIGAPDSDLLDIMSRLR